MNLKKSLTTLGFIVLAFVISVAYTNCSPVHEGSIGIGSVGPGGGSLDVCDKELEPIYANSIDNNTACATCHEDGSLGAQEFRGSYFKLLSALGGAGTILQRTTVAVNRVADRLENGSTQNGFHDNLNTAGATQIRNDLVTYTDNYEACIQSESSQ